MARTYPLAALFSAALWWCSVRLLREGGARWLLLHQLLLGFALANHTMVIAHAPVILPAVIRRPLPYHPSMWVTLIVLQIGLIFRVAIGDGLGVQLAWEVGIWITVAALLLLPLTAVTLVITASRKRS